MTNRLITLTALVIIASLAMAKRDETYDQLKVRAEASNPKDQDKMFAEVARRAVDVANSFYASGEIEKAQNLITEAAVYADKAAAAARTSGKNLKHTEITLRETARRIEGLRKSLALEERPHVEGAEHRIEAAHQSVLNQIFGLGEIKEKR